jgi:hypothetical protein
MKLKAILKKYICKLRSSRETVEHWLFSVCVLVDVATRRVAATEMRHHQTPSLLTGGRSLNSDDNNIKDCLLPFY